MKKILLAIILALTLSMPAQAKPLTLNQILESTCRVAVDDAYGTGTTIAHERGLYYILTNAHVVGQFDNAEIEYFTGGAKTLPLQTKVIWRAFREGTDVDFALLTLPDTAIKGWSPRVIPLAPRAFDILRGVTISSAGCPEARWPMAWEGAILQDSGSRLIFTPPPTGGQSGSGVFLNVPDRTGEQFTRLCAVITWRIGASDRRAANGYDIAAGGAIPVSTLYNAFEGKVSAPIKVPFGYTPIQTNVTRPINYREYALGSNGKYYKVTIDGEGKKVASNLPANVTILRWPDSTQVRFPSQPQFSPAQGFSGRYNRRGKGQNNNNNPYDLNGGRRRATPDNEYDLPEIGGIIGGGETPNLPDPSVNNNSRVAQLEARVAQLERERTQLLGELKKRDSIITTLNQKLTIMIENKEYEAGKIGELSDIIAGKEEDIAGLGKELNSATINLETTITELNDNKNVALQRNVLGAFSGLGVLSFVGWFLYQFGFGKRIKDAVDKVEDIVQDKLEPVVGEDTAQSGRDLIERLETWFEGHLAARLGQDTTTTSAEPQSTNIENKLQVVIEGLKQDADKRHPFDHPDYVQPPTSPVYQEPGQQVVQIVKQPSTPPPRVEGLGPTVPEMPAHMFTSHEIIDAVDYIANNSDDPELRKISSLVRGYLNAPRRPKTL